MYRDPCIKAWKTFALLYMHTTIQWRQHHLHEILHLHGGRCECNPRDLITLHSWIQFAIFHCHISIIGQSASIKLVVFLDQLTVFRDYPVVQRQWERKSVSTVRLSMIWTDFSIQLAIACPWLLLCIKFQWSQARSLSIILQTSQPQNRTAPIRSKYPVKKKHVRKKKKEKQLTY